ncbi:hypothetical protein NT6N_24270 [Oceaniferula spumae]|uniref:Uncharacterized protein n=1 Tax=Oceaniferula spumae TaxID=2979115 RepID=A0AAT9FMN8_9BACT
MKKSDFTLLFRKAAESAYEVTPRFVTDNLPSRWRFCININEPYEDLKTTEKSYPNLGMQPHEYTVPLEETEAIDMLWIDGGIPVWIDINVYRTDSEFTYFDLLACNRFSADHSDYYYEDRGMGPFGIKSPIFPPRWDDDKGRFSLQTRVDLFDHLRTKIG